MSKKKKTYFMLMINAHCVSTIYYIYIYIYINYKII